MVLASNEWLNNCEDAQKSPGTNTAIANHDTAATQPQEHQQLAIDTSTADTSAEASSTRTSTATLTTVNSVSTNFQIMAENSANEQQQLQVEEEDNDVDLGDQTVRNIVAASENINNNCEEVNTIYEGCDTSLENLNLNANANANNIHNANENTNVNINTNINSNTISYSNPNSNTNTLQSTSSIPHQRTTPVSHLSIPLSSPITPQALSSALQSVMNASNAPSGVGNLQNSFLSTLGIDISANTIALQQTAKQLNSSFCSGLTETQVGLTNNSTNIIPAESGCLSSLDTARNTSAKIVLICESNSHPFQTRTILLTQNMECKVGRLIAKSKASESNAIFDCKVLSRNHAVLWYADDGKFWVKDTKSSNGTFINENKLGTEPAELHFGDIVKFGVDVLENSRKEVHGCIIAFVKLFYPDGREAISIDTVAQRLQHTGEGRISIEEIHRLNLYMQEVSQREKTLKSKLYNIQNVLDATRKNSAMCWQSLIAEDQLLHRINSLEKKLQIMEKNVPDNVLRNEVLKLLEDKSSYQLTAKEALRKVYQERCEAMQMLSKMESAYASSDNECKILRDQIMSTKQSLQDVSIRLERLEADYSEYKQEVESKQQQINEEEERRTAELAAKLRQRELECDELRSRVSEFMLQRANLLDAEDEMSLQKQAIDKLDAVIGDMDLGDDGEDDNVNDVEGGEKEESRIIIHSCKTKLNKKDTDILKSSEKESDDIESGIEKEDSNVLQSSEKEYCNCKPKEGMESTILKWLQNSDLSEKEGSLDIFKAICNESDSSDEQDAPSPSGESGAGANATEKQQSNKAVTAKAKRLKGKLHTVQLNLQQLEEDVLNYSDDNVKITEYDSDEDGDAEGEGDEELLIKRSVKSTRESDSKDNNKNLIFKNSVALLREAYNALCDSMMLEDQHKVLNKESTPPPAISVQTQFQNYGPYNSSNRAAKKLDTQDTLKPVIEAPEDENDSDEECEDDQLSVVSAHNSTDSRQTVKGRSSKDKSFLAENNVFSTDHQNEILAYKEQISYLNEKLNQEKDDSHHKLEEIQIECESLKEKVGELNKLMENMSEEKKKLEDMIEEVKLATKNETIEQPILPSLEIVEATEESSEVNSQDSLSNVETVWKPESGDKYEILSFDEQTSSDLNAINSNVVQREEELILYKEQLEQTQIDNLQLRNEIADLKQKKNRYAEVFMMRQMLVYGAAIAAIIAYFLMTYF